jgi:hypothetical protein
MSRSTMSTRQRSAMAAGGQDREGNAMTAGQDNAVPVRRFWDLV